MKAKANIILLIVLFLTGQISEVLAQSKATAQKVRTIVTTDGEVDDIDSFIRMLLYANEFKLEGLVYSSSQWHYKGDGKGTRFTSEMESTAKRYGERTELRWPGTTWMQELMDLYEKVQPHLSKHASGYPSASDLRKLIKVGNINFEGDMANATEGSEWIKSILLDDNPAPVYLQIWGGTNTVARALLSIEETYKKTIRWQEISEKVSKKAIIYTVLDQDATYRKYIAPNWPKIRVFYNSDQFWCLAYPWTRVVPAPLQTYLRGEFMAKNIIHDHGPLLAKYYSWGDGRQIAGDPEHNHGDLAEMKKYSMTQHDFISEGDSPAYFQLIDVGLMSRDHPEFGGWGGRMVQSATNPNRWEDGKSVTDYNVHTQKQDASFPQTRWIDALQLDFAARADWCVKSYADANHPPVLSVKGGNTRKVSAGASIKLKATAMDPDKDAVSFTFWHYLEAGTCPDRANVVAQGKNSATVLVPQTAKKGQTIHVIVEGKDAGDPSLIRYQRVILEVER